MREVLSLRVASSAVAMPAATKPAWGNPQRFLVAGLVLLLLSATATVILYLQYPAHFVGLPPPEAERQRVQGMSTVQTMQYFEQWILPGIDLREAGSIQNRRSMVYLGMVPLAGVGAIGLILMAVGWARMSRKP